ncbi:HNH endonuclease [Xanthobacter sp. VTT E-85241]|uniref:HNH endonuclease n=1 Tax=Roseixanthobacter finlandensis TaxID=3119922 RepID=UPI003728FD54
MADWTDATLFGGPLPRRCTSCRQVKAINEFNVDLSRANGRGYVCRSCIRVSNVDVPNRTERAEARRRGEAWCRDCAKWLAIFDVNQGLCREHQRLTDRQRYATNEAHRERRRAHATMRKRGVEPVPAVAREYYLELFEGGCAYCNGVAETWDHVVPVAKGGTTTPDNILPCCIPCNSSKRDRDLDEWLTATGRQMRLIAIEHLSHHQVL